MFKKLLTITLTTMAFVAISGSSHAQVSDIEKLKARKEILKKTTELNSLEIELNKQLNKQSELQIDAEKAKSKVAVYSAKAKSISGVADVKAASKLEKLVKKTTNLSTKLAKKNSGIEKLKSKIEKAKSELNKLNANVVIYSSKENPFSE